MKLYASDLILSPKYSEEHRGFHFEGFYEISSPDSLFYNISIDCFNTSGKEIKVVSVYYLPPENKLMFDSEHDQFDGLNSDLYFDLYLQKYKFAIMIKGFSNTTYVKRFTSTCERCKYLKKLDLICDASEILLYHSSTIFEDYPNLII
jgi:hypothetical protein